MCRSRSSFGRGATRGAVVVALLRGTRDLDGLVRATRVQVAPLADVVAVVRNRDRVQVQAVAPKPQTRGGGEDLRISALLFRNASQRGLERCSTVSAIWVTIRKFGSAKREDRSRVSLDRQLRRLVGGDLSQNSTEFFADVDAGARPNAAAPSTARRRDGRRYSAPRPSPPRPPPPTCRGFFRFTQARNISTFFPALPIWYPSLHVLESTIPL